jgi:hypothetical protein
MTHSDDISRLFGDRIYKEPTMRRLRRFYLLTMRQWYWWRYTRHLKLAPECLKRRSEVLAKLTEMDEVGRGMW